MAARSLKVILCLGVCLSTLNGAAHAQNYLEPEASFYSNYYPSEQTPLLLYDLEVVKKLSAAFDRYVVARAIVLPSFSPEYAVALEKHDNNYKIFHLEPEEQIWIYFSNQHYGPKDDADNKEEIENALKNVSVKRCEISLPNDLGAALENLWGQMLMQVRYDDHPRMGYDGVFYHFYANFGRQQLAGKAWSPDRATKPGKLVEIVEGLRLSCLNSDTVELARVAELVDNLLAEIESGER